MRTMALVNSALLLIVSLMLIWQVEKVPTIGGTRVPTGLVCQEDEVIGFISRDTLGCVHIDTLRD